MVFVREAELLRSWEGTLAATERRFQGIHEAYRQFRAPNAADCSGSGGNTCCITPPTLPATLAKRKLRQGARDHPEAKHPAAPSQSRRARLLQAPLPSELRENLCPKSTCTAYRGQAQGGRGRITPSRLCCCWLKGTQPRPGCPGAAPGQFLSPARPRRGCRGCGSRGKGGMERGHGDCGPTPGRGERGRKREGSAEQGMEGAPPWQGREGTPRPGGPRRAGRAEEGGEAGL